jgi:hypothetical protein
VQLHLQYLGNCQPAAYTACVEAIEPELPVGCLASQPMGCVICVNGTLAPLDYMLGDVFSSCFMG